MPVILKKGEIAIKDRTTGEYDKTINVVAEQTTADMIEDIQQEGTTQIGLVEAKGESVMSDIPASYDDLNNIIAESYDSTKTYSVGDYVRYYDGTHDKLYRCITDISTAEAWTSGHWAEVVMADEVSGLKSVLNVNASNLLDVYDEYMPVLLNGYDSDGAVDGKLLSVNNGGIDSVSGYKTSELYFKIKPNTSYYGFIWLNNSWFSTTGFSVCWYDVDKIFISGQYAESYKSPENAKYARISVKDTWVNPIFCEDPNCSGEVNFGYSESLGEALSERIDVLENALQGPVICVRSGNDIQIKTNPQGYENQICYNAVLNGSYNKGLDFAYCIESDGTKGKEEFCTGTNIKYCGDDICPVNYNSSFHGGNHGQDGAFFVTQTSHGKTLADIGSIWKDANDRVYTIFWILDNNRVGVVCITDNNAYPVDKTTPVSPLVHLSGATHTENITFTATAGTQIRPAINHHVIEIANDKGQKLESAGTLFGEYIDIVERYGICDVISAVQFLQRNIPNNTYLSMCDDSIDDDAIYEMTYRFFDSGACVIFCSLIPVRESVNVADFGITQSQALGSDVYVPYTDKDTITTIGSSNITFEPSAWNNEDIPPNKYYQIDGNNAFVTGYILDGDGEDSVRKITCADSAGYFYAASKKAYPYFYRPTRPVSDAYGSSITGMAFRGLVKKGDTAMTWYKVGADVFVEIEFFDNYDGTFILPDFMDGLRVEVVKKYDSVLCLSNNVSSKGVYFRVTGKGSATLRLY